jgi:2-octaprenyl-6-methoxyphenol hydroxylase
MPAPQLDVLIRGAGPVGCSLALALAGSGRRTAFAEHGARREAAASASEAPFRPIALSYASRLILERLGAWSSLATSAIETIHVSQRGGFGRTVLAAQDAGVPALGYVVDYQALCATLFAAARAAGVGLAEESRDARCVVHAEGSAPDAPAKRYDQDALVALIAVTPSAGATAYERFTEHGPLALLPHAGGYALIWSTRPERALQLATAGAPEFLRSLREATGPRIGRAESVAQRSVQPLALRVRTTRIAARAVYIGNAAQTVHPVAGQGLNLGLRDAWDLAQAWRRAEDPGDPGVLARYAASRRLDAAATIRMTDLLAAAFLGSNRMARLARGAALTALDILPQPRRFFARRMIFGPSALP